MFRSNHHESSTITRERLSALSLIGLIISAITSLGGCAPRISETLNNRSLQAPVSSQLMIRVDEVASEIRWSAPISIASNAPLKLRNDIARNLERALNAGRSFNSSDGYYPARFLLEVHNINSSHMMMFIPCFIYFAAIGCPHRSLGADITLSVEYRGQIFSTSASGDAYFNIYNQLIYPYAPEVSPVAAALGRAIKQLAPQLRAASQVGYTSPPSDRLTAERTRR